jgi:hypothetical protein
VNLVRLFFGKVNEKSRVHTKKVACFIILSFLHSVGFAKPTLCKNVFWCYLPNKNNKEINFDLLRSKKPLSKWRGVGVRLELFTQQKQQRNMQPLLPSLFGVGFSYKFFGEPICRGKTFFCHNFISLFLKRRIQGI